MAITIVGTPTSAAATVTANLVITKPTGVASGDLLIAVHNVDWGGYTELTAPAGWTLLDGHDETGTQGGHVKVWYKTAGGSEPASYTFGQNGSSDGTASLIALRGTDSTPTFVFAKGLDTGDIAPSVTPTGADDFLICVATSSQDNANRTYTPPTGMTERTDTTTVWCSQSMATLQLGSSGATGTKDFGASTGARSGHQTQYSIAVKASASSPTASPSTISGIVSMGAPTVEASTADAHVSPATILGTATLDPVVGVPFIAGVSANNRYLVDQYGDPILLKGDTIWTFVVYAGAYSNTWQEDFTYYADTRASQGFNALHVGMLSQGTYGPNGTTNYNTHDGVSPWDGGVEGNLNETYWQRVDWLIDECARNGITVFVNLMYHDDVQSGAGAALGAATNQECFNYGFNVATRYLNKPNVNYVIGGDWFGDQDAKATNAFNGVTSAGFTGLIYVQNYPESTSREDGFDQSALTLGATWSDLDYVYTYNTTYWLIEQAYQDTPAIPVVWGDGHYDGGDGEARLMRNLFGWAFTSGGLGGHMLGTEGTWQWPSDARANLTTSASNGQDLPAMRSFVETLGNWQTLIPDISGTFITGGRGTKANYVTDPNANPRQEYNNADTPSTYVTGAKSADGKLALLYVPNAGNAVTVATGQLAAGWTATWVDPANNTTVAAGSGPSFTRGVNNSAGSTDWWLLFEVPSSGATVTPSTVNGTASIGAPAVTSGDATNISATTISRTVSIGASALGVSYNITATTISRTISIGVPSIITGSGTGPNVATINGTASLSGSARAGIRVTVTTISATASVGVPSLVALGVVAPATITVTVSISGFASDDVFNSWATFPKAEVLDGADTGNIVDSVPAADITNSAAGALNCLNNEQQIDVIR